jgi:hypothetical protein
MANKLFTGRDLAVGLSASVQAGSHNGAADQWLRLRPATLGVRRPPGSAVSAGGGP